MNKAALRVLVVEDDQADYLSVSHVLSKSDAMSYSLAQASTMEDGKRMLEESDFDAVILDLGLPDAAGVDSVINFNASAPVTPIVVLSGQENPDIALGTVGVGAEDFLPKSDLSGRLLEEKIRFAIERHGTKLRAMERALEEHSRQGAAELAAMEASSHECRRFLNSVKTGNLDVQAWPVIDFKEDEAVACSLQFEIRPGAIHLDRKGIQLARVSGCLEGLTLACVRRALEFGRTASGFKLHLDLEIEVMNLEFVRELLWAVPDPADRGRFCFFLPARFDEAFRGKAFRASTTLMKAGFEVGVREAGGGGTVLENIMLFSPAWIRLSPLLFHGLADFKIKRDYLRHWVGLLNGLHAPLLADKVKRQDFLMLAEMGLSGAVL